MCIKCVFLPLAVQHDYQYHILQVIQQRDEAILSDLATTMLTFHQIS